jgi:metal-responsive CopG/Arc/MetJ family transcriptional regulator
MKTAISVPNGLFEAADKLARRLGVSRSRLYADAVEEFLGRHRGEDVTEKLDRLYENEQAGLDSISDALQGATLGKDEW